MKGFYNWGTKFMGPYVVNQLIENGYEVMIFKREHHKVQRPKECSTNSR